MIHGPAGGLMHSVRLVRFVTVAALACGLPQWAAGQSSTNYAIPLSTFNAGVGDTSSANFHLSSSLGDSFFTGPSSSANFQLTHGLFGTGAVTGPPPALASAASRKVHGSAGTFDLPLSLADIHNPTTEPRIGPAQTIVFTYDKPITAATATITEGIATAGTPTFSGNDVIVGLTGVTNKQYVTVSLSNVASSDGGAGGSGSVRVGFLAGDVNQNRVVTVSDVVLVNAQIAHAVTAANFLKDVNATGTMTVGDKVIVNANVAKALPAP
jgi:hypothetical protein